MLTQRQINLAALPDLCYSINIETGETVILKKDETGYYPTDYGVQGEAAVTAMNQRMGVTPAQRAAMEIGSMAGFHAPGANPDRYDENGRFKREPKVD
ncbi:hypothetical protein Ccr2_gp212c [Caulobacter phage Ccr2]|uniref:Uncharacterized protein n=5 Tax=Viruses TaxID=10239 RepID=K4JRW4_9CAUD|nr:hypothetical protein D865_gp210 [Caulobacter phage phiCbK]ARB13743.1 hypothetical protein Ccr10_gp213c [Caulobacter phage Ccr10]ARB14088.1 hypothetical protein Ccr2_gp212c [Caulobacter phage Ccr2]ARB14777.1 hypothetical protein Ccr29_gp221 [Caulobacter phage Ccr29]ARB15121.1 hypothetical protein Ccr32_gp203 [Caulobacter phage Ccr32]ARB15455.1 hypothetical protein Ccr34_gp213 [Caulobacter phage Ccr34]